MPVTGPFYDYTGAPYYYNTDTQQRLSAGTAGTNLGASPALGSPMQPATFIPQNLTGGGTGALGQAAGLASQFSYDQLAQQKDLFQQQLQFERDQMERMGIPQLVIQQRMADLAQQQFQYQMLLTQQQQGLAQQQFGLQQELGTQGLGLQALQAQAQLGGPSNWVQAYNLAQGLRQTDIPVFMQRLLGGTTGPAAVGGAGLGQPQSLQALAAQAGAGGQYDGVGGGVPSVTVNGQPVGGGGGAQMGIGGQINPFLAPMAPLTGGGGGYGQGYAGGGGGGGGAGGGAGFGKFMSGNPAPGTQVVYNAPGPNSPNDTRQGTLMPGTTGMYSGATQNFGYGPGQGSQSITGTRGTNITGYDPATGKLYVNARFLTEKPRVVMGLYDVTAGHYIVDPSNAAAIEGAQGQYDPHQGGWMAYPYLSGSNINTSLTAGLNNPIDPSHQYTLQVALPEEGGVGSDINDPSTHPQFSGAQILGLGNPAAPARAVTVGAPTETQRMDMGPPSQLQQQPQWSDPYAAYWRQTQPDMGAVSNLGRAIFTAGGGALGPQALESIGQTGNQMLQSVGQSVGADWPTFAEQYMRSRIGQQTSQPF